MLASSMKMKLVAGLLVFGTIAMMIGIPFVFADVGGQEVRLLAEFSIPPHPPEPAPGEPEPPEPPLQLAVGSRFECKPGEARFLIGGTVASHHLDLAGFTGLNDETDKAALATALEDTTLRVLIRRGGTRVALFRLDFAGIFVDGIEEEPGLPPVIEDPEFESNPAAGNPDDRANLAVWELVCRSRDGATECEGGRGRINDELPGHNDIPNVQDGDLIIFSFRDADGNNVGTFRARFGA